MLNLTGCVCHLKLKSFLCRYIHEGEILLVTRILVSEYELIFTDHGGTYSLSSSDNKKGFLQQQETKLQHFPIG